MARIASLCAPQRASRASPSATAPDAHPGERHPAVEHGAGTRPGSGSTTPGRRQSAGISREPIPAGTRRVAALEGRSLSTGLKLLEDLSRLWRGPAARIGPSSNCIYKPQSPQGKRCILKHGATLDAQHGDASAARPAPSSGKLTCIPFQWRDSCSKASEARRFSSSKARR